jgi:hypothetical protein
VLVLSETVLVIVLALEAIWFTNNDRHRRSSNSYRARRNSMRGTNNRLTRSQRRGSNYLALNSSSASLNPHQLGFDFDKSQVDLSRRRSPL